MIDALTKSWVRNTADEKAAAAGMKFDLIRAAWPCWWIGRYCRLYEGSHAGEPLVLRGAHSQPLFASQEPWAKGGKRQTVQYIRDFMEARAAGEPCDWQLEVMCRIYGWIAYDDHWQEWIRRFNRGITFVSKKNKKALALDTLLPTPRGWTTIGEVKAGDTLFSEDGTQCRVIETHPIVVDEYSYEVTFSNGERARCNGDHLWKTTALQCRTGNRIRAGRRKVNGDWTPTAVRDTLAIAHSLTRPDGAANHSLDMPAPLEIGAVLLPIPPYVLGVWLGTCHKDDYSHYRESFERCGVDLRPLKMKPGSMAGRARIRLPGATRYRNRSRCALNEEKLLHRKRIPPAYLRASIGQRTELLQGLMDTDGCADKAGKNLTYCTKLLGLSQDVGELLSSLGIKWVMREYRKEIHGTERIYYWIQFNAFRDDIEVFTLPRKLERMRKRDRLVMRARSRTVQITAIKKIDPIPMRCITVDSPSGMFLFGRTMLPTHNSPMIAANGLYLLCGDGEQGQKVYLCATTGDQAKEIAGKHAVQMVLSSPELSAACHVERGKAIIQHLASNSVLQPLYSGNVISQKAREGLNGSGLVDEAHVVNADYVGRISRMGISRKEPLFLGFSTAGDEQTTWGYQQWDFGTRNNESGEDLHFFFQSYEGKQTASDAEIAAHLDSYIRAANPALGHTVRIEEVRQDYANSVKNEKSKREFYKYRLNIWGQTKNQWLPGDLWAGSRLKRWSVPTRKGAGEKGRRGEKQPAWGAIYLGYVDEPAALTLVWPADTARIDRARTQSRSSPLLPFSPSPLLLRALDQPVRCRTYYWLPRGAVENFGHAFPYAAWEESRCCTVLPGVGLDMDRIARDIIRILATCDVQALAYDPGTAGVLLGAVCEAGHYPLQRCFEFPRQAHQRWAFSVALVERLLRGGKLKHRESAAMDWEIGHAEVKPDRLGGAYLVEPERGDRKTVAGPASLLMALDAMAKAERFYRSELHFV